MYPLLGLDILDGEQLYADNAANRLIHRQIDSRHSEPLKYPDFWSIPLDRFDNHLYAKMEFPYNAFYTTAQLPKMLLNFAHPSAEKLYKLLKTAGLEAVDKSTLEELESIFAKFEPCHIVKSAPSRFRMSIGHENIQFNARAYINIMYLDGKPALHIVDEATRFSAARFLSKISTDAVWEALILCWSSVYAGLP